MSKFTILSDNSNKGESLRRHPPELIHLIPSFRSVLFCVAVPTDRKQIREVKSHRRIINVLRCDVDDMVDCISGSVEPAPETDLT